MSTIKKIDPTSINLDSAVNEREVAEVDPDLTKSIENIGILQTPGVRKTDDEDYEYEVVYGKRRIMSAIELGLEEIEVEIIKADDYKALYSSLSENAFRLETEPTYRVKALKKLWDHMRSADEDRPLKPSPTELGEMMGVSPSTINRWLEGADDVWEGTVIEAEINEESDTDYYDRLGEGKVSALRRGVEKSGEDWSPEELDRLIRYAAESELSTKQCREAENLLAKGADTNMALEAVTNDLVEETHKALEAGSPTQTINASDLESVADEEEERETQWLEQVEDAEEDFSEEEPTQKQLTGEETEFKISFTVDDSDTVAMIKTVMEELNYDDPNMVVKLALDRFLLTRKNES